jgi:hypothetical protein
VSEITAATERGHIVSLNIEQLSDAIRVATEEGGAYGKDLHPSKPVILQVGDRRYRLGRVSAAFLETGVFGLILTADQPL